MTLVTNTVHRLRVSLWALALLASCGASQASEVQVRMPLTCNSGQCLAHLYRVPAGKVFKANQMSCLLDVAIPGDSTLDLLAAEAWAVDSKANTIGIVFTPLKRQSQVRNAFTLAVNESYASNERLLLIAKGGQMIKAVIQLNTNVSPLGECAVSGTLSP